MRGLGCSLILLIACGGGSTGSDAGSDAASAEAGPSHLGTCGGNPVQASCLSSSRTRCQEYNGYADLALPMSSCDSTLGTYVLGPCPGGAVGGCQFTADTICQTLWYYPPTSASTAEMNCASIHEDFVTP